MTRNEFLKSKGFRYDKNIYLAYTRLIDLKDAITK